MRAEQLSIPGKDGFTQKLLRWVNLRPEESERTVLMFAFYTVTSIGLLWFEASSVGLFLQGYGDRPGFGAEKLPWIYMVGAALSSVLGFLYSWLPRIMPLRQVIVFIPVFLAAPLLLFHVGLLSPDAPIIGKLTVLGATILLMRLWLEVASVLNDLNTSITANQLFNIREIKRSYPLISSGVLVADVVSGFSLPLLLRLFGLPNVILIACVVMGVGVVILLYLSHNYQQFFPDARRRMTEDDPSSSVTRRVQGPLRNYMVLLFTFFILAQVLYLLVDFQFLSQLEIVQKGKPGGIASFIGYFNGTLGIFELAMQWFVSSRLIERMGLFAAVMFLPAGMVLLGGLSLLSSFTGAAASVVFGSLVTLKFWDELLHFTLFASTGPVLFQPMPDSVRNNLQSVVRGIAEPLSTGVTGLAVLTIIWVYKQTAVEDQLQSKTFVMLIVLLAGAWLLTVWLLRAKYVGLLVLGAERGQLSISDVDLRELKRAVVEALNRPSSEADKRSCIELLTHIDPQNVGEVMSPILVNLPPALQRQSLEAMMPYPNVAHLIHIRALIDQTPQPEVLAVALRYLWLTEADPDIRQLRPYLRFEVDPVVRGTAASLVLRRGTPRQKAEATNTLRQMLTHKRERERVMGCRALGEAVYMQALRLHIPNLLQDESLRVRCALLEAIAATHLEEYYPSLLRGIHYKSTREAAVRSLVRLENEALSMLTHLAEDTHKPDVVRLHTWSVIGQIGTMEAQNILVSHLLSAWGATRRNILSILLKMPQEAGINAVLDRLGRTGVETMIDHELLFMGQLYAALMDLQPELLESREADLLRRSIHDVLSDTVDRLFLLMKLLYPLEAIQAAAFNLQSNSRTNMARGLEILDNTLDIASKRILLAILDRRPDQERFQVLSQVVPYQPMTPSDRLRHLLELRHFLSDWCLSCCFHLARNYLWSLTPDQTIACLRHPTGFVREAVLSYLRVASPRALKELLPLLKSDPDRLVAAQVAEIATELGIDLSTVVDRRKRKYNRRSTDPRE